MLYEEDMLHGEVNLLFHRRSHTWGMGCFLSYITRMLYVLSLVLEGRKFVDEVDLDGLGE